MSEFKCPPLPEAMKAAALKKYGLHWHQIRDPAIREDFECGFLAGVEAYKQWVAQQEPAKVCRGIPRPGCNYFATCDTICNKCGKVHSSNLLITPAAPAQQQEPK